MLPEPTRTLSWWCSRIALPVVLLACLAILIGRTNFDRGSLEPFFNRNADDFALRRDWFFEGVLHIGGRTLVAATTVAMLIGAVAGWRSPHIGVHARRCAYLVVTMLLTVAIAGLWKELAHQVTPWNTIGFGGRNPWPGSGAAETWFDIVGSPGAHAASGFAWVSLYFVGASLGTRNRGLWLAPGILLGLLFALGQHVRGAHPPSHEFWSLAIAWGVAAVVAAWFRRRGWLDWTELARSRDEVAKRDAQPDPILPWLAGLSMALLGAAFFALDRVASELESEYETLHRNVEIVELLGMVFGLGVAAWLMADRIGTLRARSAQRLEQERARRFQLLGRMAASVAHEVRNPLHTLRLIVDEQQIDVPALKDHALRPELETCIQRIDRAVELVYRLARPEAGEIENSDLPKAVRDALASLERLTPGHVQFEWLRPPSAAVVCIAAAPLGIVLDNVLRNAVQASPAGSTVTLDLAKDGTSWILRIRNEGSLHKQTLAADKERGLGLGMSISRQIVASVGGRLELAQLKDKVECALHLPGEAEHSA